MVEVQRFIDLTFLDGPTGTSDSKPIASPIAWLRYRFRSDPFRMSIAEIMDTPLRILYQELRCWQLEQGVTVRNRSEKKISEWLQMVNEARERGDITDEEIAAANERWRKEAEQRARNN